MGSKALGFEIGFKESEVVGFGVRTEKEKGTGCFGS